MKNKTGFTLIELLAVIIILAIIALIATPIVLNVVEESRETARRSSISGYASGVRYAAYDSGFVLTGKLPEITKEWAEANVEVSGDKIECEEVRYSSTYETVLHKCRVGKSEKEYCFAGGKIYEDPEDSEYKAIYNSLGNVAVNGKPVVEELLKQYNESNTVGLLKDDTGYYYKGTNEEVSNNFVWFGGHLWRVISIDNDNNLTMITNQSIADVLPVTKWATEEEYNSGYLNTWLNATFLGNMKEADRNKIQNNVFNIGTVMNVEAITAEQKVGLLDVKQYQKTVANGDACSTNTFLAYPRFSLGNFMSDMLADSPCTSGGATNGVMRPVIKVNNLAFDEGNGTLSNPYRMKNIVTQMAQVQVGEYISVPTSGNDCGEDKRCTFRVVSKDNDSIKVILNGLLPSTSALGYKSTIYTSGNPTDEMLKTFANTIDNKYRYTGDRLFYIGQYSFSLGYEGVKEITHTGNIGLPVMGEMFTSNDIDVGKNEKIFVNINTIENPMAASHFWTMNSSGGDRFWYIADEGKNDVNDISSEGVRPVLFLNSNLDFTSGEGTAESPFMLGE